MRRLVAGAALLAVMFVLAAATPGQDKADPPKLKGQLPQNWKKLGLSEDQTQRVYAIQSTYKTKVDVLAKQIRDLREKERTELETVLTDAQKNRLREILLEKVPDPTKPTDPKKPDEKKPAEKKPDEKKPDEKKPDEKKPEKGDK